MSFHYLMRILMMISFVALLGCDKKLEVSDVIPGIPNQNNGDSPQEETPPSPDPDGPNNSDPVSKICSRLDFDQVVWPESLTFSEQTYYALALNITGSFEGKVGWKNIAGNFDGQGISLGLMQQNLGQGTLQPLLIDMFRQDLVTMQTQFDRNQFDSLKKMLEDWLNDDLQNPGPASIAQLEKVVDPTLFPNEKALNQLDLDYHPRDLDAQNNSKSVFWAKSMALDKSGSVTPLWKKSFQEMAVSAHYRSLQIEASTGYFLKAKSYFEAFRFRELRYLLMMYDFVVQNGGFNSQHLSRYQDWLMANPNASEEERAFGLLEVRLTTVRPQFVADVRARKTTIIKGAGTVHQTPRDLPKEYCFDPRVSTESN